MHLTATATRSWRRSALLLTATATIVGLTGSASAAAPARSAPDRCPLPVFGPGSSYHPRLDRPGFRPDVTNPWYPLPPGRTFVYTGVKDGEAAVDVVTVTGRTRLLDGVRTRVVEDRLLLGGHLAERTSDYYAQDACGNVWYFGEDTAELDRSGRVVDRSGSFHAGVGGAQPGVFMQADPQLGRRFRQEWLAGEAEDTFRVVDRNSTVTVPDGHFRHALRTEESTALEPGVLDNKHYVRGIGEVDESTVRGGDEHLVLVEVL
jgi:hypothetical protein